MAKTRTKYPEEKFDVVTGSPVKAEKQVEPVVTSTNSVLDEEYRWCGDSIPLLLKAILRELVMARLARESSNGK